MEEIHLLWSFIVPTHSTVGLDAAGKTTILYKLKLGEIVTTIPTIGKLAVVYQDVESSWFVRTDKL